MNRAARAKPKPVNDRLRQRLRGYWDAWWTARLPPTDPFQLSQRNVYIVPTAAGWAWALTVIVMLVAAINYQLSLGYALTFALCSAALAAMHSGHATLRGLSVHATPLASGHVGQTVPWVIEITNAGLHTRRSVGLRVGPGGEVTWFDVAPGARARLPVRVQLMHRGWQAAPRVTLFTLFPIGIFRVWAPWQPALRTLVYPAPEASAPAWPATASTDGGAQSTAADPQRTLRPYRRGDPLHHVLWRRALPGRPWVSHPPEPVSRADRLWLSPALTGLADHEAQLSRLCAWVLRAQAQGCPVGLNLDGQQLPPHNHPEHYAQLLGALALA